ncbi:hypothetical protein C0989_003296, partial [Termitomyces sp. Mn162]
FTVVEIEDPDAPVPRILNVHDPLLEPDGSLNVSQISWLRKGDIYMEPTVLKIHEPLKVLLIHVGNQN